MADNISALATPYQMEDSLDPDFALSVAVVMAALSLSGAVGNLLTILAVALSKQLYKPSSVYLVYLATADFIISLFIVPVNLSFMLGHPFSDLLCKVLAILTIFLLYASILSMTLIAIDRYTIICKHRNTYDRLFNRKTVPLSIVLTWLYSAAFSGPLEAVDGYGWNSKYHSCTFPSQRPDLYYYIIAFNCSGLILPVVTTSVCYTLIIAKLHRSKLPATYRPASRSGMRTVFTRSRSQSTTVRGARRRGSLLSQNAHAKRTFGLIMIFAIFIICWIPVAVIHVVDYEQRTPSWLYVLLQCLTFSNSFVNVYVYALTNRRLRRAYRCLLTGRLGEIRRGRVV